MQCWGFSDLMVYTWNIGFKNTPKQVLAFSNKTLLNKDFALFHIKLDPHSNLPDFFLKTPLFLQNQHFQTPKHKTHIRHSTVKRDTFSSSPPPMCTPIYLAAPELFLENHCFTFLEIKCTMHWKWILLFFMWCTNSVQVELLCGCGIISLL